MAIDTTNIVINTERLILRAFSMNDLHDFFEYASVPGVGEAAGWSHHKTIGDSEKVLQCFLREKEVLALFHKKRRKVIGSLGLHDSWVCGEDGYSDIKAKEIGFVLSKDYWGQGIMVEAVEAVISYGFKTSGLDAFTCSHFVQNHQSKRVVEKCGFIFVKNGIFYSGSLEKNLEDLRYIRLREKKS